MPKMNYRKKLEQLIEEFARDNEQPTLLLHVCCAPCSSYVLEYLVPHFRIKVLFYNPNITQAKEYEHRLEELKRFVAEAGYEDCVQIIEGPYDPSEFFDMAAGMEDLPERGLRCYHCYELRMRETAKTAAKLGFDYFTTTLSVSPHKNAEWINEIGEKLYEEYGVKHLPSDFKKKSGYLRSIELSGEYNLYRQNYCGCVFSKKEALKRQKA